MNRLRSSRLLLFSAVVLAACVMPSFSRIQAQAPNEIILEATAVKGEEVETTVSPEELQAATEQYFTDVEEYRSQEGKFVIAREQYYKLNTLASLDEVIRRSKDVLRARAKVLESYIAYLRLIVRDTKGIEIADKTDAETRLEFWQTTLREYQEKISALETREQVDAHFKLLNSQKEMLQSDTFATLTLIKIGELQTALDTGVIVRQKITAAFEGSSASAADRAIATRGLEEVDGLLQRGRNHLYTLTETYRADAGRRQYNEGLYRRFQTEADFTYLQLRQALAFMKETTKSL